MNRNNNQRGGIKLRALLALSAVILALSAFAMSLSPMTEVSDQSSRGHSPLFGGPDELTPAQNLTDVVFVPPSKK